MAYASPADLKLFFDERVLRDLASDTGVQATLGNDARVEMALDAASGKIDAALFVGGNYTPDELGALTGNSLNLLKYVCSYLAMGILIARRPEKIKEEWCQAIIKEGEDFLDKLRQGIRTFDIDTHLAAGRPTIDGLSTVGHERINLLPSRVHNFYPHVGTRLPLGR